MASISHRQRFGYCLPSRKNVICRPEHCRFCLICNFYTFPFAKKPHKKQTYLLRKSYFFLSFSRGLGIKRNEIETGTFTVHLWHRNLEVGECCSASHLEKGMLHCEQLCFKARSHQGMFSETSGSILSCYSILLPRQSSELVQADFSLIFCWTAGEAELHTHTKS